MKPNNSFIIFMWNLIHLVFRPMLSWLNLDHDILCKLQNCLLTNSLLKDLPKCYTVIIISEFVSHICIDLNGILSSLYSHTTGKELGADKRFYYSVLWNSHFIHLNIYHNSIPKQKNKRRDNLGTLCLPHKYVTLSNGIFFPDVFCT